MRTYLTLLHQPRLAWALGGSLLGRLHESMLSFAVILLVSPMHGYTGSGAVLAAAGLGQTVGAPWWGRQADRTGHRRVLAATAAAQAVALLALAGAGASLPPTVALGAVVGLVTPPLTPAIRAVLPRLVTSTQRSTAFALESTLQELVFLTGPLAAGAAAALWGARTALAVAAGCTLAGTVVYVAAVRDVRADSEPTASGAGLRPPVGARRAVRVLIGGAAFLTVLCLQSLAVVQRVSGGGAVPAASWYLAATSVGSLIGGLFIGPRLAGAAPGRRFLYMAATVPPLLLGTLVGDPVGATVLLVGTFAFGVTVAPVATTLFDSLSRSVPTSRATEAFGWMGAAMGLGGILGDGAGGWILDRTGPVVALALCGALALAAARILPVGRASGQTGSACDAPAPPRPDHEMEPWSSGNVQE